MINNKTYEKQKSNLSDKKAIKISQKVSDVQYSPKIALKKTKLQDMLKSQQIDQDRIDKIDDVIQKYMSLNKSNLRKQPENPTTKKSDVVFKRVRTSRKYTDMGSNKSVKNYPIIKQQKYSYNSNDAQDRQRQNLVNEVYYLNQKTPLLNRNVFSYNTNSSKNNQKPYQNEYLFSANNSQYQSSPINKGLQSRDSNNRQSQPQQQLAFSNEDTNQDKIPQMRYTQQRQSSKRSVKRYVIGFDRNTNSTFKNQQEDEKILDKDQDLEPYLLLSNEIVDSSIDENDQNEQEEQTPLNPMQEDDDDLPLKFSLEQMPIKLEENINKEQFQKDLLEKKIQSNKKNQLSQIDEIRESCFQDSYANQIADINIEEFYKSDNFGISKIKDQLKNPLENSGLQKSEILKQQRLDFFQIEDNIPLDENFQQELPERNTLINAKRQDFRDLMKTTNSQEIDDEQDESSQNLIKEEKILDNDFSIDLEQPQRQSTQNILVAENNKLYPNYSFNKTEFFNHFNSLNDSQTTDKRLSSIQSNDNLMKNSFVPQQFVNNQSSVSYDFDKKSEQRRLYEISTAQCLLSKPKRDTLVKKLTSNFKYSQIKPKKNIQKIQKFKLLKWPKKKLQKKQKHIQTDTINYDQKIKEFLLAVEMERMLFMNLQLFKRLQSSINQFKF